MIESLHLLSDFAPYGNPSFFNLCLRRSKPRVNYLVCAGGDAQSQVCHLQWTNSYVGSIGTSHVIYCYRVNSGSRRQILNNPICWRLRFWKFVCLGMGYATRIRGARNDCSCTDDCACNRVIRPVTDYVDVKSETVRTLVWTRRDKDEKIGKQSDGGHTS